MEILSHNIAALRTSAGETQEEAAAALGISNKTVSKWENGDSSPDADSLIAIAKHYKVTIDFLLGLDKQEAKTADSVIEQEYSGRNCRESVLQSFRLALNVIRGCTQRFRELREDSGEAVPEHIVSEIPECSRSTLSANNAFQLFVNHDDVNMVTMLYQNKSDFSWMADHAGDYAPLFAFLSDTDALKLCALIHISTFPENFTVSYISSQTGIEAGKCTQLLEASLDIGLCSKKTAHLAEGDTDIYTSYGDGKILSVITMAYEHMCGRDYSTHPYNGFCKMIRGDNHGA